MFISASNYNIIDEDVVREAIDYMLSDQNDDGSFNEPGKIIHSEMVHFKIILLKNL